MTFLISVKGGRMFNSNLRNRRILNTISIFRLRIPNCVFIPCSFVKREREGNIMRILSEWKVWTERYLVSTSKVLLSSPVLPSISKAEKLYNYYKAKRP